jgi:circadian clock protein KaiC
MTEAEQERTWQVGRVPTGVPNLDVLLDGGLTRGGLVLIVGGPGAGKTVLAQQMVFHWAGQGQNVLWLVTLGEPNEKFLSNVSEMAYYDRSLIGTRLQLVNLSRYLHQGLEQQLEAIRETIHSGEYSFVIIDGFQSFRCFLADPREVRRFLSELSAELALAGITLIVTLDARLERYWESAEFTLADAIIALDRTVLEGRERRRLRVPKLRGRPAVGGHHSFSIDALGLHIYPRIESVLAPPRREPGTRWLSFGLPGLDRLLEGGVQEGTSTLIAGSIGTGKSMLASHFLAEGLRQGEPCLELCLFERLHGYLERADRFGLPLLEAYRQGTLTVHHYQPSHWDPDECAWEVVRAVEERGIRRLVIDGIEPIECDLQASGRTRDFVLALTEYLYASQVTSLFTYELPSLLATAVSFPTPVVGQLASNLIVLRFLEKEGRLRRMLSVVKTRYSEHSSAMAEILFREGEMVVVPSAEMPAHEPAPMVYYGE